MLKEYADPSNSSKYHLQISFRFAISDIATPCYIEKDAIKVALVNEYDLRIFKWFHYLYPGLTRDEILANITKESDFVKALAQIDLDNYD